MKLGEKELGVVVSVDSDEAIVGMYNVTNGASYFMDGEEVNGIKVGAYAILKQGRNRIVVTVLSEKVRDQLNTINSKEFDNRFHAQSIQRIVKVKSQGVIKDGYFSVTSSVVPMVGNVLVSASSDDIAAIFSRGVNKAESVAIGRSIMENQPIRIPINGFFASHIGIFGNTGSGKSNTLHKLYLELFNSPYGKAALEKSSFVVIDFNGEYGSGAAFKNCGVVQRYDGDTNKIPIDENILFDINTIKILVKATENTQTPFLARALEVWKEKQYYKYVPMEIGLLKKCLTSCDIDLIVEWRRIAEKILDSDNADCMAVLKTVKNYTNDNLKYDNGYINNGDNFDENTKKYNDLKLKEIENSLSSRIDEFDLYDSFFYFVEFQKIFNAKYAGMQLDWLNPVVERLGRLLRSVKRYAEIKDSKKCFTKGITIYNLKKINGEYKETFALLISKMFYEKQKADSTCISVHLIIDEAHNILNSFKSTHSDVWEDYRLTTFESMIKEGRKYGFFLTIASQRPADISPTIMSQIHNYIIHKLVNDKDLQMLGNTMPTLDAFSKSRIPTLGKGEAILTGRAFGMPSLIKVDYEEYSRPDSDDVDLIEAWSENPEASK